MSIEKNSGFTAADTIIETRIRLTAASQLGDGLGTRLAMLVRDCLV